MCEQLSPWNYRDEKLLSVLSVPPPEPGKSQSSAGFRCFAPPYAEYRCFQVMGAATVLPE